MEDNFGFEPIASQEPEDDNFGFRPSDEDADKVMNYITDGKGISEGESMMRGFEQGPTLGHADEIGAMMGSSLEASTMGDYPSVNIATSGPGLQADNHPDAQQLSDLYKEYLSFNRQRYKDAEQANPGNFTAGAVVGSALIPNAAFGKLGVLAKDAGTLTKVAKGAGIGAVGGAVTGAGNSEAPVMSGEFADDVLTGFEYGGVIGAGIPAAVGTSKGIYEGTKYLATPFLKGFKPGLRGITFLGESAEKAIQAKVSQYGDEATQKFMTELNGLATIKKELIKAAEASGNRINSKEIDEMIVKRLGDDPMSNLPFVRREMEELREILATAKEGPVVEKVERVFYGDKPTKIEQFKQKAMGREVLDKVNSVAPQTPDDVAKFEADLAKRQREQKMVPGGTDPRPIELEYRTTGEPGQIHGVQKQAQFDADGNPIGYKKVASKVLNTEAPQGPQKFELIFEATDDPNMLLAIHRRPVVDPKSGKVTGYQDVKSQLVPKEEAAKYKDISVVGRGGGRDLSRPTEMWQLYKDLKQKSMYGDKSFQSQEAQETAGGLIKDINGLMRGTVPGVAETDAKIASLKRGLEFLGIEDTINVDPVKIRNKIIDLINKQENLGGSGGKARNQVDDFRDAIKDHYPELANEVERMVLDLGEQAKASKAVAGLTEAGMMNTVKRSSMAVGNAIGLGVHKTGKAISSGLQSVNKHSPEKLTAMGTALINSQGSKATVELGKILLKAATEPERARNAILFGLMQNPAYRKKLDEMSPKDEEQK